VSESDLSTTAILQQPSNALLAMPDLQKSRTMIKVRAAIML
jgi:hypothetical protein